MTPLPPPGPQGPGVFRPIAHPIRKRAYERNPMRSLPALVALFSLTLCVSCGNREPERAEGGAATGAATGAAVGLVGGPVGVVAGGLIGGAAGAATGAATKPK